MSKSEIIFRHSIVNGDSYEVVQFKRAKFKKYGVRYEGASQVLATMDTEEKARMYLDALLQGIGIGQAKVTEIRSLLESERDAMKADDQWTEGRKHGMNRALYLLSPSYQAEQYHKEKAQKSSDGQKSIQTA